MMEIKAYVRDFMADKVLDALARQPKIVGIATTNVTDYGRDRESEDMVALSMVKFEVNVDDTDVASVVDTIAQNARTGEGHASDGWIYVSNVDRGVPIGR